MSNENPDSPTPVPLSTRIAFVVHLTSHEASATEVVSGRVEHVSSGRTIRFSSAGQLVEFMRRAVSTRAEPADSRPRDAADGL
jgi:hypothetical protein